MQADLEVVLRPAQQLKDVMLNSEDIDVVVVGIFHQVQYPHSAPHPQNDTLV